MKGAVSHNVTLGTDPRGNLIRIDNALANIPERMERAAERLATIEAQQESAKQELGKPFPQEEELARKSARLAELDAELNMEDRPAAEGDRESENESHDESIVDEPQENIGEKTTQYGEGYGQEKRHVAEPEAATGYGGVRDTGTVSRPSVLADLRAKSEQVPPPKKAGGQREEVI